MPCARATGWASHERVVELFTENRFIHNMMSGHGCSIQRYGDWKVYYLLFFHGLHNTCSLTQSKLEKTLHCISCLPATHKHNVASEMGGSSHLFQCYVGIFKNVLNTRSSISDIQHIESNNWLDAFNAQPKSPHAMGRPVHPCFLCDILCLTE